MHNALERTDEPSVLRCIQSGTTRECAPEVRGVIGEEIRVSVRYPQLHTDGQDLQTVQTKTLLPDSMSKLLNNLLSE